MATRVWMKTSDLSRGERLVIDRRRRGHSQKVAAERFGVSLYAYRRWEDDGGPPAATGGRREPPRVSIGSLRDYEECFLLRRREGMALSDLAMQLGLTMTWVCEMEYGRGSPSRLVEFWRSRACPWRPSGARARA